MNRHAAHSDSPARCGEPHPRGVLAACGSTGATRRRGPRAERRGSERRSTQQAAGARELGLRRRRSYPLKIASGTIGGATVSFLTGADGKTLYTFKKDAADSGKSACNGGCADELAALRRGRPDRDQGRQHGDRQALDRHPGRRHRSSSPTTGCRCTTSPPTRPPATPTAPPSRTGASPSRSPDRTSAQGSGDRPLPRQSSPAGCTPRTRPAGSCCSGDHAAGRPTPSGPADRIRRIASATPPVQAWPWPGRTHAASTEANRSSEAIACAGSAVNGAIIGPVEPLATDTVASASPTRSASREATRSAALPGVWPGRWMTVGDPGTSSVGAVAVRRDLADVDRLQSAVPQAVQEELQERDRPDGALAPPGS